MSKTKNIKTEAICPRCNGSGIDPDPLEDPYTGEPLIQECEICSQKRWDAYLDKK
jgi:hypothetical protein